MVDSGVEIENPLFSLQVSVCYVVVNFISFEQSNTIIIA